MSDTVELQIKKQDGTIFRVEASLSSTVEELKEQLVAESGVLKERQRLVFSGRVLQDNLPLTNYNLTNGAILYVLRNAPRPQQSTAPIPGQPHGGGGMYGMS